MDMCAFYISKMDKNTNVKSLTTLKYPLKCRRYLSMITFCYIKIYLSVSHQLH